MAYSDNLFSASEVPAGIPLSQYTNAISNTLAMATHLSGVWVIAELSDVRSSGGHCYMELIEKNEAGQTVAKLRATIWRTTYIQLRQKFFSATQREISNGIKALVRGSASHHSLYGLSFNIIDIDPSYTMGDMERLRREIIRKLQKEGIADSNKKLQFPPAPQKIAVISAEGAAGYGDFMNHLCNNSEGYVFYPCLFPCVMQGDKTSASIRRALGLIEATIDFWDCVVIIRGGGATTDLNGFDDYELAKAVATFKLPVVVGIGHERDRNVLDEIAHTSLKTPTAVAGFFIDSAREAFDNILTLTDKIRVYTSELMLGEERRLSTIQVLVPQLALQRLADFRTRLHTLTGQLPLLIPGRIEREKIKIEGTLKILQNLLTAKMRQGEQGLDHIKTLIGSLCEGKIERWRNRLENIEAMIKVLDPKNTLERGYSITRINGQVVKSVNEIVPGAIMATTLKEGEIRSIAMPEDLE